MKIPADVVDTRKEPFEILWEGPCAYVVKTGECYEVMIHSTNHVVHVPAGMTDDADRAERACKGLNAYPRQARERYNLL